MKKVLLIILLVIVIGNFFLISFFMNYSTSGSVVFDFNEVETGFVSKVIDGDTVIINGESVRLLGMDTAERGEDCYKEAKVRLEELVLNKEVELSSDVNDKDQYKRLLRWILIDGENVNLVMVEEGLAIARFYEDKKYKNEILNAEKEARANRIGCKWQDLD
jgi:endonuclease YncB( thermonuclease family)